MAELTAQDEADLAKLYTPTPTTTPSAELKAAAAGTRVADSQGDLWTKQWDQLWLFRNGSDTVSMTSDALLHVWGPVNFIPESGL